MRRIIEGSPKGTFDERELVVEVQSYDNDGDGANVMIGLSDTIYVEDGSTETKLRGHTLKLSKEERFTLARTLAPELIQGW